VVIYWNSPAAWFLLRGGAVAWGFGAAAAGEVEEGAAVGGVVSFTPLVGGTVSLS
jgi:hypothetical protein